MASFGRRGFRSSVIRPLAEVLEGRQLLATITVNTVGDGDGADGSNTLSLRQAIEINNGTLAIGSLSPDQAALVSGPITFPNVIDFAIPGVGPFTITPGSPLPAIRSAVVIDGYTEPGAHPNTNGPGQGKNTVLEIALDGSKAGADAVGLSLNGTDDTVVRGLAIGGFHLGLSLGALSTFFLSNERIEGNFLGTDVTGTVAHPNGAGIGGIASNDIIGGTAPGDGNLISGNTGVGVAVDDSCVVQGNFIGTDITGTRALPNGSDGLSVVSTSDTIGGTTPGAGNLISGNLGNGIGYQLGVFVLQGNRIGTDVTGTSALPNQLDGVGLSPVNIIGTGEKATIGGTAQGAGNIISGNLGVGLFLGPENLVQGNFVGTDQTGSHAIPNGNDGIELTRGSDTIGGTTPGAGNVISGNTGNGITTESSFNLIQGNLIGTDATGTKAIPNGGDGIRPIMIPPVQIRGQDTIGGTTPGAGNVLSGNGGSGLTVGNLDVVQGNFIGTDRTGSHAIPNGNDGINVSQYIDSFGTLFQVFRASSFTIGGTTPGAGNVISGNLNNGLVLGGSAVVQGNFIGTDATGTQPIPNGNDGVHVLDSRNTIGGTTSGSGNVIAFNGGRGVALVPASTDPFDHGQQNAILSDSIFGNAALGIDLGGDGVTPNNPAGSPSAPNQLQPYPVITSASLLGSGTGALIAATLDALPSTAYTVQFFANPSPDPSGHGQGQTLLGSITVTTDGSGHASFTFASNQAGLGQSISATATDPLGNTSEFSLDSTVGYPTTTQLVMPGTIATLGQPTTFAAVVSATNGGVPTGRVEFLQDGIPIGSSPIIASNSVGVAVLITTDLTAGPHAITAIYLGDSTQTSSPSEADAIGVFAPNAFGGPAVTSAVFSGPETVTITFNRGLTAGPAQDLANYRITGPGHRSIKIVSASYNPKNATVRLTTASKLNTQQTDQLTINGETGDRVVDVFGIPLNGRPKGKPGTNFVGPIHKPPVALKAKHPTLTHRK